MASEVQKSVGGTDGQARKPVPQYREAGKPMPQTERLERLSYKWRVGKPVPQYGQAREPVPQYGEAGKAWATSGQAGKPVPQYREAEKAWATSGQAGKPVPQTERLERLSHT